MKKDAAEVFETILREMNEKGIATRDQLMKDEPLYCDFWLALRDFVCQIVLLSKTSRTKEGITDGNAQKIDELERYGITTREDVESACILKLVVKLDMILAQPLEKQYNYCYQTCNNLVIDTYRKAFRSGTIKEKNEDGEEDEKETVSQSSRCTRTVSYNRRVSNAARDDDRAHTYEDTIGDNRFEPERRHIAYETFEEIRDCMLQDIEILSSRPKELMARFATKYYGMKPEDLIDRIQKEGWESVSLGILERIKESLVCLSIITGRPVPDFCSCDLRQLRVRDTDTTLKSRTISDLKYSGGQRIRKKTGRTFSLTL